jgi:hypothetical protein
MRRVIWICVVATALLASAADAVPVQRVDGGSGLSVIVPHAWRLAHTQITTCSSPAQRLVAVTGPVHLRQGLRVPPNSALVLVMEGASGRFPARPGRFTLPRLTGGLGGCCAMPVGRGAELLFRDHGRRFYAFVYIGSRAPVGAKGDVAQLLNSLRVAGAY